VILVRDWSLRVVVVRLVLGTSPVLNVEEVALFTLHDAMNGAQGGVLVVIVQTTSELPLFSLAKVLVDVAASVMTAPVLVEVGT
jgi:hypothetical protein